MMNNYDVGGWDWLWMAPMMIIGIAALGIAVYAAVRLAMRDEHRSTRNP